MLRELDALDLKNSLTLPAAFKYYEIAREIDEVELAHCIILASKMYEPDQFDLEDTAELDEMLGNLLETEFDLETYCVEERTIVQAMDFNLYVF